MAGSPQRRRASHWLALFDLVLPHRRQLTTMGLVTAIAGALPLLYGMAEGIVAGATYEPEPESAEEAERPPAVPAMGTRRSRLHEAVGYHPD